MLLTLRRNRMPTHLLQGLPALLFELLVNEIEAVVNVEHW